MADVELAACCAAGDAQAVRHVVTANNQRLFRAAWSILRNREEAEDVLQSAYAKALAAMASFEGRSSLTTWMTRITINEALARKRGQERRRKYLEAEGVPVLETYREHLAKGSQAPSPEAEAARAAAALDPRAGGRGLAGEFPHGLRAPRDRRRVGRRCGPGARISPRAR